MGDVICTLPVAGSLKKAFPDCRITWVVSPTFAPLVYACKNVDVVVEMKSRLRALRNVSFSQPFDIALDMQGLLKSALVLWKSRAPVKLGYHWQREGSSLFSSGVKPSPSSLHIVDQYMDVARAAGGSDDVDFGLSAPYGSPTVMKKLLGDIGDYVVLNPGAAWVTKRWPPEQFAQLARMIEAKGLTPVIIGGKAEEEMKAAHEIAAALKDPRNICGQTDIVDLIDIVGLAKAHVGSDTGTTHLAAALGVPAIGLYSLTKPVRSCPYGQIERCVYEPRGLSFITSEEVWTKLEAAL